MSIKINEIVPNFASKMLIMDNIADFPQFLGSTKLRGNNFTYLGGVINSTGDGEMGS